MNRSVRIALRLLFISVAVLIIAFAALFQIDSIMRSNKQTDLGEPILTALSMTDQRGQSVTEEDLLGKPAAWFFGFTRCPSICPTGLMHITRDLKGLGADASKINAVFVTLDPERDTPEILGDYMKMFDPRIIALRGTEAETEKLIKSFSIHREKIKTDDDYTIDHTTSIILTDAEGRMVGTLDMHEPMDSHLPKLRNLIAADEKAGL
jgi:protein SCO1/2